MPLLQAHNISYQFDSGEVLFKDLSCNLTARRVGLIGRNGAGKSVLASVLMKQLKPSEGVVTLNATVQFFAQLSSESMSRELTLAQFLQIDDILYALKQVESGRCESRWFDIIGERWQLPQALSQQLAQLGLPEDFTMPCRLLSGGQLSCLQLWSLFQSEAELLVLDEPSNHLDSQAKQWLIEQLAVFKGHILLISHDRVLLREMAHIWALSDVGLRQYGGGYAYYLEQQQQEQLAVERQLQHVQRERKYLEAQVQRNSEKAEQRASKGLKIRKQGGQPKILLNGMRSRATASASNRLKNEHGRREFLQQKTQSLQDRHEQMKRQNLHFMPAHIRKGALAYAVDCVLPYGSTQAISFAMTGSSKVHVQGRNGCGKSTLLKVLMGEEKAKCGHVKVNVPVFYLDQHFALLDDEVSMLENVMRFCTGVIEADARTLLAGIGFRRDRVYHCVKQLSGGEKMKLAMLIVTHQPNSPLLLLDEPDNHLDVASKWMLASALTHFEGAFMLVSHDEEFVGECNLSEVLVI